MAQRIRILTPEGAAGRYSRKRPIDPRDYGAVGNGATDDTAALQAAIDAAGAGAVELPLLTFKVTGSLTLPSGCELRGSGPKGSILQATGDFPTVKIVGGEAQSIKNLKIANSFVGTRTTYDIEIVNPFKPVLEHVEIALGQTSLLGGGVRIYTDAQQAGTNNFMPQLNDVWVRNGRLLIENITDGKVHNCYLWGTYTGAGGTVELRSASNWTFDNVDVVPPQGNGAAYLISLGLNNLSIIGGLIDGSYDNIMTGHGIMSTDYVRGLTVTGVKFFNLGRSGLNLFDTRRSVFVGNIFVQGNKADNAYPDINLTSCTGNVFLGNTHGAPNPRTTPGRIYVEDGASGDNLLASSALEINSGIVPNGHYYNAGLFTAQPSTAIRDNRPQGNWPTSTALAKTTTYSITKDDLFNRRTVFANGTFTVTLPSVNSVHAGDDVIIKNTGTGTITVATTSSQLIDGATTQTLTANQAIRIMSTGSGAWGIVAKV